MIEEELDDIGRAQVDDRAATLDAQRSARHELASALLLAIATVLTACAAFQATVWIGETDRLNSRAGAMRIESTRASNRAAAQTEVDVNLWAQWVDAALKERRVDPTQSFGADGNYAPAAGTDSSFYYGSFRREFRRAFDAWIAARPFTRPDAPATPFGMRQYRVAEDANADRFSVQGEHASIRAEDAAEHGRGYVLLTIVFASALALAGLAIKFRTGRARQITIGVAALAVAVGTIAGLTLPVEF